MPLLGQASGGWTESSSALRILNLGLANSTAILTDDAFTQANPPIETGAAGITAQVDQTLTGVLSGSVAFARGDAGGGSNQVGGPVAPVATANVRPVGVFINNANGNSFENTPGTASGVGPYVCAMGVYGNTLFEDKVISGANIGNALTAYTTGQQLWASRNGYLTNAIAADYAVNASEQVYEGNPATFNVATMLGIVKMPPDATQGDLVYDQRI